MISVILDRRSVRRYLPRPVEPEKLARILQCALYAPNGGGHQVPRFLVAQDALVGELDSLVREALARCPVIPGAYRNKSILPAKEHPEHRFFFDAPVLIIAVAPAEHENSMADCSCALENIQLAAAALGLGSCWVNQIHWICDDPAVRAWLLAHGMRETESVFGSAVVGYAAAASPPPAPRKEGRIVYLN